MKNPVKLLRPKANALLDFPAFLRTKDFEKAEALGNALAEYCETLTFPPPLQKFLSLPKVQELISWLQEGGSRFLENEEVHAIQLLTTTLHQLAHLNYTTEEIAHPVVRAKALDQNIQDYLICIRLLKPYEGVTLNLIVEDLSQSVQQFLLELMHTVANSPSLFTPTLVELLATPPVASLPEWYPITRELHLDGPLIAKLKGNTHKILNQLQTILSDMSAVYLRYPIPRMFSPLLLHQEVHRQWQLEALYHAFFPLHESLSSLLPHTVPTALFPLLTSTEVPAGQFAIGFYTTLYASLQEPWTVKSSVTLPLTFLESYYKANPLYSLHSGRVHEGSPPLDQLHDQLVHLIHSLSQLPTTPLLREKIQALHHLDLPSFAENWYTLGEVFSVLYLYSPQQEDVFTLLHKTLANTISGVLR